MLKRAHDERSEVPGAPGTISVAAKRMKVDDVNGDQYMEDDDGMTGMPILMASWTI